MHVHPPLSSATKHATHRSVVYLCICVFVYLCICVSVYLCICVFVYLFICVSCICVSAYLCICVFVYVHPPLGSGTKHKTPKHLNLVSNYFSQMCTTEPILYCSIVHTCRDNCEGYCKYSLTITRNRNGPNNPRKLHTHKLEVTLRYRTKNM